MRISTGVTAVMFSALTLLGVFVAPPVQAAPAPWFDGRVGLAMQVVSVESTGGARANVSAWQRGLGGWQQAIAPVSGWVGPRGIAPRARDGIPATPAGVFSLDYVFGTGPAPGGLLPYRKVGANDWWVGDPRSPAYNTHQVCAPGTCPFNERASERLAIPVYEYAIVMGVNKERVPGNGGAFFMHLTDGTPTLGCVAVERDPLLRVIRWLMPGAVIAIR